MAPRWPMRWWSPRSPRATGDPQEPAVARRSGRLLERHREREKERQTLEQRFVGIDKAELVSAELRGKKASIAVRFVSELISATRNKAGEVIEGDPKQIREVTEMWTFERDTSSRDPNWKLAATEAPA